jgi:RNA polymerase sigma-70 factor (ECF subfamily)
MDPAQSERSDEQLLRAAAAEPEAFALFYRRHVRALSAYFWRRSRDAETAADLTAETFAAALDGCARFDPSRGPAIGWLYGIAHRQLGTLARRGAVEQRARRRLGMARLELDDVELGRFEADAEREGPQARVLEELAGLPPEQRAAVEARVLHELDYAQIATAAGASEPVVRKRVSRGLATLRGRLGREQP